MTRTRMFRAVPTALLFLIATNSFNSLAAQIPLPEVEPATLIDHVAALSRYANAEPVDEQACWQADAAETGSANANDSQPLPFQFSTMTADLVPPYVSHPELAPVESSSPDELSFEENTPVKEKQETIDQCCTELAKLISVNLESDISIDAKKLMVETALKMVSRNVALKAQAKIMNLKAEHALEIARMQSQMSQMRSMANAAQQINYVAGPLRQMLQRNYQQSLAASENNERLSQILGQIGSQRLENDARVAKQSRERIRLTRPTPAAAENDRQLESLADQIAYLQQQLHSLEQRAAMGRVEPAGYNQSLQPLRQPLGPLPQDYRRQNNSYQRR